MCHQFIKSSLRLQRCIFVYSFVYSIWQIYTNTHIQIYISDSLNAYFILFLVYLTCQQLKCRSLLWIFDSVTFQNMFLIITGFANEINKHLPISVTLYKNEIQDQDSFWPISCPRPTPWPRESCHLNKPTRLYPTWTWVPKRKSERCLEGKMNTESRLKNNSNTWPP